MYGGLLIYLTERSGIDLLRDALDVAIVFYACYRVLLLLRGTRAMQIGIGLGVVLVLYVVARALELATVLSIMGTFLSSLLLIVVVVFQNDIRRGLQRIGSQALFARFTRGPETKVIDEVVEAATELARHRIGALIAFEQDANLDEFVGVHKGHLVDARVSRELLVSLFVPEGINKLHDGAVVIRNLRIAKAGVFFPMPEQRVVDASFGSRHRAALGITEETDAVVVAVSEERGTISFCFNGNIASNLDGPKLRTMLEAVFSPKAAQRRAAASRRSSVAIPTPLPLGTARGDFPEASRGATIRTDMSEMLTARQRLSMETDATPPVRTKTSVGEPRAVDGPDEPRIARGPDTDRGGPLRRRGLESEPPPPLRGRGGGEEAIHTTSREAGMLRRSSDSDSPPPLRSRAGVDEQNPGPSREPTLPPPPAVPRVAIVAREPSPGVLPTPSRGSDDALASNSRSGSQSGEEST